MQFAICFCFRLSNTGLPSEVLCCEELTTLDLSHNQLTFIPEGLESARSLLVLNLSHNKLISSFDIVFKK